jgi:hypothetical protein
MTALLVLKDTVSVELRDARGRQQAGELYVTGGATERETLQSVLNRRRFVPVRSSNASVSLLQRDHLLWVSLDLLTALDELEPEAETATDSCTVGVRLTFSDGTDLEGTVRYLRPAESRRLSDYLESAPRFLPVRTADRLYLVNRDRLIAVTPTHEIIR